MDEADATELRARAIRYRRLMASIGDVQALEALKFLADDCDARAAAMEKTETDHALERDVE